MRRLVLALASVAAALALIVGPATAGAWPAQPVSVSGHVADPASYTVAHLAALPQTAVQLRTLPWARAGAEQGLLLETLVDDASPNLPDAKNTLFRVAVTVSGLGGRSVTFALGELDPSFGNHPAVAVRQDGVLLPSPELAVPVTPFRRVTWPPWPDRHRRREPGADHTADRCRRSRRRPAPGAAHPVPST